MQNYTTIPDFLNSTDADKISKDPDYRYKYSNSYTYHPFHAMSMLSGGSVSSLWCSQTIIIGAEKPSYARGMGFTPLKTYEDAIKQAERYVGKNPRILCTPESFSGGAAVHLGVSK
ncbi:MAG TPA: hypothetical protein DCO79_13580 [Spirochaeta sp.]|nr:hypothetical protein [Spirochaeta sp.]